MTTTYGLSRGLSTSYCVEHNIFLRSVQGRLSPTMRAIPLDPPVITATLPSSFPTTTPSSADTDIWRLQILSVIYQPLYWAHGTPVRLLLGPAAVRLSWE